MIPAPAHDAASPPPGPALGLGGLGLPPAALVEMVAVVAAMELFDEPGGGMSVPGLDVAVCLDAVMLDVDSGAVVPYVVATDCVVTVGCVVEGGCGATVV